MKKILSSIYIGILSLVFVFAGVTATAQFSGGFSASSPWFFETTTAVNLRDAAVAIGTSANRILKLWVTDVDISGVLTLGGSVGSGGIDLDGNPLIFDADADTIIDSTTDDRLDFQLGPSGDNLQYSVGAFAFQEGTTISTTANALTFTPTTDSLFSNGTGIVVGHTAQITVGALLSEFQVLGTSGADSSMIIHRASANSSPAQLFFAKGRDAIGGTTTALTVNDDIANIRFYGSDGTDFGSYAAEIMVSVDAATGNNDLPGRMIFSTTADGDASPTERMRIDSAGLITITGSQTISSTLGVTGVATFSNATTTLNGIAYGWPVDNGTADQRLTTDGTGVLSWQTVSAGANTALSNLTATTTINTSLVSDTDSTDDLGSSSIAWNALYVDNIFAIDGENILIRTGTSDGADNKKITIAGGGGTLATRGSKIEIQGNELSSGTINLVAGSDVNNSKVNFKFTSGESVEVWINSQKITAEFDSVTDLGETAAFWDETFTDEIVLSNDGTAATAANTVRLGAQDLAAGDAGLLITTENDIQHLFASSVGIATTTPVKAITIHSASATSTIFVNSGGAGLGGSIIFEDNDGVGCTEMTFNAGVQFLSVVTCP